MSSDRVHATDNYRTGFLEYSQEYSNDPAVFQGDFDVALVVPSWDPRSTLVVDGSINAAVAIVPLLENRGVTDCRSTNESRILTYLHRHVEEVQSFSAVSEVIEATFEACFARFQEAVKRRNRPLRVFIELSTCPRYLSLGITASLLRRGWASDITFAYTGGEYLASPAVDPFDFFTVGRWTTAAVPGLEGWHDPGKSRAYLVSVGFEGAKTYRLIASADPERVMLLFPEPGVNDEYVVRAREENAELIEQYVRSDDEVVRAGAADLIGSLRALERASLENPDEENLFYLTCGSKPQSLALGLRAFQLEFPAILYPVPQQHRETSVEPVSQHWVYSVSDLSAVTV